MELRPPVSESPTSISKFYDPTDSEHKFHKTRIENWQSIGFELGFPWLRTYCHNHYTMLQIWHTVWLGDLWTIRGTFHFPWTVQVLSKSILSIQSSMKPQQKTTTICCLIICKYFTQTKLCHPARCCVGLRKEGRNSKNKNGIHLLGR